MKVLQILPQLNIGGVERGTLDLSKALIEKNHQSFVISGGGSMVEDLEMSGAKHFEIPVHVKSIKTLFLADELAKTIAEIDPDIIHIRSRMPAWVNYRAYKRLKKKPILVSTFHGLYSFPFYSKVMSFVDHAIAISNTVESYILKTYKLKKENITIIPRGCDPKEFDKTSINADEKNDLFEEFPKLVNKKVLTIPARITKWKGVNEFIELLSMLDDSYHGLIVGPVARSKKSYFKKLIKKVESLKLEQKITFAGSRKDIANIYKISDLVFNLSQTPEPFGRTMIEAIACGRKVIGWNHGGASEILNELFPMGLVELNNMDDLQETTINLCSSDSAPKENIFTAQKMTDSTIDLYERLIEKDNSF
tara:strand:- start:105 stop:1196 length:1092 start_codon:yes stop_codon:yes gene_type:complete